MGAHIVQSRRFVGVLLLLLVGLFGSMPASVLAAQQFQGLCAFVKMEILQELTLERIGFLATLEITNNEGDANITDFSAALTFADPITGADASDRFFVQPPRLRGISGIDGTGILKPGETGVIEWFIIPKIAAGGLEPAGQRYDVGALLAGRIYGQDIAPNVLTVIPDTITVLPEPQLEITYFQPRDVEGDDPFTPEVESPIPFTLGVLVKNAGAGLAKDLQIKSEQPRILENQQSLVFVAQLLGSRVDDQPTDQTSLTVNLGDVQPGQCRKGAWDMITSLSGQFIEFNATFTHAPELGGRDTSVITDLNAYFIAHEVLNDQPGRDNLKDFLADTIVEPAGDPRARDIIPDTLFETDCNTLPVNQLNNVTVLSSTGLTAEIEAVADIENWVYMRVADPQQSKLKIARVVRSDGKVLNANNYWTNTRFRFEDNARLNFLHIFDFVALGTYTYTVTYEAPSVETDPPVTTLRFDGPVEQAGGQFLIRPETQIFFTANDASPVSIFYRFVGDVDFQPALPFNLTAAGTYEIEYFSRDDFGNEEVHQFATLVLSSDFPVVANLVKDTEVLFIPGDSVSVRPEGALVQFDAGNPQSSTDAAVEIFRGVIGFPTLTGVPSSPTRLSDALITVGGEQVDFYRYRLNGGAMSVEFPVTTPIGLSGLSGANTLEVFGRSRFNAASPTDRSVSASWQVDAAADVASALTPTTPNGLTSASIDVSGSALFCYRVDGSFYRPEPPGGGPIVLTGLAEGPHTVEVLSRASAGEPCPGDVPGNAVSWLVDRSYGFDLPVGERVREARFVNIGASTISFNWDGRDDAGAVVAPGHYSLRVTVSDSLGRSSSAIEVVRVGDMLAEGSTAFDVAGAAQREPHARGQWLVWQDQRNGNWDVFALNLHAPGSTPQAQGANALAQERPRTDGQYAVWEDRQPDGNWDIALRRLGDPTAVVINLTGTPGFDERRPSIDWPWVVFQRKPIANPAAPNQLVAFNLQTASFSDVDPSGQDQLDPSVQGGRVVWQDLRDVGAGEIYFKDLESNEVRRITTDPGGQIQPDIYDQWIVWADNRAGLQLDLFGYNLKRGVALQLTATAQDEARPRLNEGWVVYTDDSTGAGNENLRLLHLSNLASVQLTNFASAKNKPTMASGRLAWVDRRSGQDKVMIAELPDLQPVFNNRNAVAVTAGMAAFQGDAHTLLRRWNEKAGVTAVTRYTTLLPTPVPETATLVGGVAGGSNFALDPGSFLWVKFDTGEILDLGLAPCAPIDLAAGVNAFGFGCFPDQFSAYDLLNDLGLANVRSVRSLDSASGEWTVASVHNGEIVGENFEIPSVAVLLVEMVSPRATWLPGAP